MEYKKERRMFSAAGWKRVLAHGPALRNKMTWVATLAMMITFAVLSSTPAVGRHLSGYTKPTGLGAGVSGDDVTLTWTAYPSANFPAGCTQALEIRIFREDNGSGTFNQIMAVGATDTMYTDQDLADGTYVYKIQARCNVPANQGVSGADTNNLSAFSDTANAVVSTGAVCAGVPTVEASASPLFLWPPNGKLVPITVTGTVTPQANCTMPENITYSIVDEYGELTTAYPVSVSLNNGSYNFQVSLEASRLGNDLDGRLYQIQLDTADGGMADINVIVPHDQRKK